MLKEEISHGLLAVVPMRRAGARFLKETIHMLKEILPGQLDYTHMLKEKIRQQLVKRHTLKVQAPMPWVIILMLKG
jgi:hypothetical protein